MYPTNFWEEDDLIAILNDGIRKLCITILFWLQILNLLTQETYHHFILSEVDFYTLILTFHSIEIKIPPLTYLGVLIGL